MNLAREHALSLDASDELQAWRERFVLPQDEHGHELVYLCGHSLGAQPLQAGDYVEEILRDWRALGVEGHFRARHPWTQYEQWLAAPLARLAGALPHEVVAMNTLTVNLHLMLASFYRPAGRRTGLLLERNAFPSDRYAVDAQIRWHGLDPERERIELAPREGEALLRTEDILERLARDGSRIATVLLPGIQYLTGQALDLRAITRAARDAGCVVGWDLAHAIGNVPLELHASDADFAVWCHYKYVNGGPGAIGGAFVHERHARDTGRPRLAGWWGNELATRFRMAPQFEPSVGAAGWQVSTPPVLAMAPIAASLECFEQAGLAALRRKSIALTGYLDALIRARLGTEVEILTPADPAQRGAMLSLRLARTRDAARAAFDGLRRRGFVPDWREPDVIRVAPVPFYNRYDDAWRFVDALRAELDLSA